MFDELTAGDVVFMDGSHRVFENSDATVFFLDVLPSLPSGVLVGIHDILLPDDYLPMWTGYHWSEQYLMAAHLLAEGEKIQLELACSYITEHPTFSGSSTPSGNPSRSRESTAGASPSGSPPPAGETIAPRCYSRRASFNPVPRGQEGRSA